MRVKTDFYGGMRVWLSGEDTARWALDNNPRSPLAGKTVYAELTAAGRLIDWSVNGSVHCAATREEVESLVASVAMFAIV